MISGQPGRASNPINHCNETKQSININGIDNQSLPNTFNVFFSRFERSDLTPDLPRLRNSQIPQNDILISQDQVKDLFEKTNNSKAPGPDDICGSTLHHCAEQLSGVFSHLFQRCVDTCTLLTICKCSTIIPIPKVKNPRSYKHLDLWPFSHFSCSEKL